MPTPDVLPEYLEESPELVPQNGKVSLFVSLACWRLHHCAVLKSKKEAISLEV
jgi:G:T-mismatch repair DNA endonuclease (very short patch repair protein)